MAHTIQRVCLRLISLIAWVVTRPAPPGWRPSRKRNDLDFL